MKSKSLIAALILVLSLSTTINAETLKEEYRWIASEFLLVVMNMSYMEMDNFF